MVFGLLFFRNTNPPKLTTHAASLLCQLLLWNRSSSGVLANIIICREAIEYSLTQEAQNLKNQAYLSTARSVLWPNHNPPRYEEQQTTCPTSQETPKRRAEGAGKGHLCRNLLTCAVHEGPNRCIVHNGNSNFDGWYLESTAQT